MVEEQTLERPAGMNVGAALLDEYLELKRGSWVPWRSA